MKILSISNPKTDSSFSFGRKPTARELPIYKKAINEGLKSLDKEFGLIIHNSSVPSKISQNTGIGSLLSKTSEAFFVPFLRNQGVTSILQDPTYLRRSCNFSPYDPLSTSKNIYMIPLEKLASEEYGYLLKPETFNIITTTNDTRVDYDKISKNYDNVLRIAYDNFYNSDYDTTLQEELNKSYNDFKTKNWSKLEPNAIYEILSKKYNNEDWKTWNDIDKYLYEDKTLARVKEIRKNYAKDIDFHIFKQWLVEREIAKTNQRNEKLGIKIIADTPVAFTPTEEWLNKDLFIEDFAMGCPPDYFSADGQRWGFAVLNHKKLFNPDGTLAKGGIFLQNRYEDIFSNSPGGVRIDHLIGLIDSFVYRKSDPKMNETNSGRIFSSPDKDIFKEYTKKTEDDYLAIFTKIIFPTAEKYGITRDRIICEDLGHLTEPVKNAIYKLNLTGLSVTQFGYSGFDAPSRNVIMPGGHDNKSYIEYTNDFFENKNDYFYYKTHILGSDTATPEQNLDTYREEIRNDKNKFIAASFTELFTSPAKKVQMFFTDFFGIGKTYNIPGTQKDCWTLRLDNDFEDLYYENLQKGIALNIPEVISNTMKRKNTEFISAHKNLIKKLDYFAKKLKE